jgi:hypothetical protein
MPETGTKKYEKVEIWTNHPLTPSSQGRGIDINITGDTPAPARASLDPFKSGFPGIITASFAIHIYLVVCIRDLFHTNHHSPTVAGGTNSYEKLFFTLTFHACKAQPGMKIGSNFCRTRHAI